MSDTLFTAPFDGNWAANDWDFINQLDMIGEDFNFDGLPPATSTDLVMEQPGFQVPSNCDRESFGCANSLSDQRFMTTGEGTRVARCPSLPNRPDQPDHAREILPQPYTCIECRLPFPSATKLSDHAIDSQHRSFGCVCGKRYARVDVLGRHLDTRKTTNPKYPCKYCKNHRGKNGFRRKDHLVQHIRGYHKFDGDDGIPEILPSTRDKRPESLLACPHEGCPKYRAPSLTLLTYRHIQENKPFKSMSDYTKHMREEHDTTPFPCTIADCERRGAKGYVREKDLMKHHHKLHAGAPYIPKSRESQRQPCPYGCSETIYREELYWHVDFTHRNRPQL